MTSALDEVALICPHDGGALLRSGGSLACANGHSFDIARQGYVNLLPVGQKASRHPGDSAQMVLARSRVMGSGLFQPLADALIKILAEVPALSVGCVVDSGCGEGWFTEQIQRRASFDRVLGLDVSKDAIRAAARRSGYIAWAVASGKALPVAVGEANVICCLFGFPFWAPWAHWQHKDQCVVTVDPGPDHLLELRECIYPQVQRHDAPAHEQAVAAGYRLLQEDVMDFVSDAEFDWLDLLDMTPHGRRCSADARQQLEQTPPGRVRVNVIVRVYQRTGIDT